MIKLIHGDCLEEMKNIEDESIDLTVTSPPYDNLRNYNGCVTNWNSDIWEKVIKQLYRLTKKGGIAVWVVGDATINGSETGTSFKQTLYAKEIGFNLHDTMIAKKKNPIPQIKTNRYTNTFEFMFIFSKGKPVTCNYLLTLCNSSERTDKNKKYQRKKNGNHAFKKINTIKNEKILTNIWEYDYCNGGDRVDHPAIFPEQLAYDHILSWSNPDDIVLDPFMGSGTVGKMAKQLNRKFIGIEICEKYYNIAKERINNEENING